MKCNEYCIQLCTSSQSLANSWWMGIEGLRLFFDVPQPCVCAGMVLLQEHLLIAQCAKYFVLRAKSTEDPQTSTTH